MELVFPSVENDANGPDVFDGAPRYSASTAVQPYGRLLNPRQFLIDLNKTANRVGQAYGGWPDRLYLIDREGRVVYQGGPGPFAFNPRELEQSLLLMMLDESTSTKPN